MTSISNPTCPISIHGSIEKGRGSTLRNLWNTTKTCLKIEILAKTTTWRWPHLTVTAQLKSRATPFFHQYIGQLFTHNQCKKKFRTKLEPSRFCTGPYALTSKYVEMCSPANTQFPNTSLRFCISYCS